MELTEERNNQARLVYPDVLRAIAAIYVIIIHVTSSEMWWLTSEMWEFKWLTVPDALTHCAVPLFFMLSGMFLLSPEKNITFSKLFKKYILRLVIAYVGWSAFYSVFTGIYNNTLLTETPYDLWNRFIDGHYHLANYIPLMIGAYLTVPFLKAVTDKKDWRLLCYIMAVMFLFTVINPNLQEIFPSVSGNLYRIDPSAFNIYVAYFFFGYYFSQIKVSNKGKYIWLGVMVGSAIWVVYSTFVGSTELGFLDESKWYAFKLPMVLYTISSFMTFRNFGDIVIRFPRVHQFLRKLADLSFTVYLCHPLVISILAKCGFYALTWHPIISVPVLSGVVLILSMILASILISIKGYLKKIVCTKTSG